MSMDKFFKTLVAVALIASAGTFTSCGGDDDNDDEPATELKVSPSELTLLSDANSSASFSIECKSGWTVSKTDSWLAVSATSGNSNATITVTALNKNESSSPRTATILVSSGDKSEPVSVSQLPAYESGCSVEFTDLTILARSVAFKFILGSDVNYFYVGWIKSTSSGWTDDKIVQFLTDDDAKPFGRDEADQIVGMDGLVDGTSYSLVAVGFDSSGKRGEVTRHPFTTPVSKNSDPIVYYSDVAYSSTKWSFTTTPNGYTQKFYMIATDGLMADVLYYAYTDAEIAATIKDGIAEGKFSPFASNTRSWNMEREAGATSLFISSWGVSADNEFSPVLNSGYWTIGSSSVMSKSSRSAVGENPRIVRRSAQEIERLKDIVANSVIR